jgi:hypothetical protein
MRSSVPKIQAAQNSGTCSAIESIIGGHSVKGSAAVLGPGLNSLRVENCSAFCE